MSTQSLNCPNCGAPLVNPAGRSVVLCDHCGSSVRLTFVTPPSPPPAAPSDGQPLRRVRATTSADTPTVGEYGRPLDQRPAVSALASVTLGPPQVAEVVRLLRDQQEQAAIDYYHAQVGGSLAEAQDAIAAIEAGLQDASAPVTVTPADVSRLDPPSEEVKRLLRRGERSDALRLYRQMSGATLYEAVIVMDDLDRQRLRVPAASGASAAPARSGKRARGCAGLFGSAFVLLAGFLVGAAVITQFGGHSLVVPLVASVLTLLR
jgi:hypothetical protein